MTQKVMNSFVVAILAVVLIPIVYSLAVSANVTGITLTIVLLFPVFIALVALFAILKGFTGTKY
jgi:hypothetical protein